MKTIQKISTLLTMLIVGTQLYGTNTRSHGNTSESHSAAKGAAVGSNHTHNQQPQAAGVAAAGMASKNSQDSGSGSSESSQPQSTSPSSSSPVATPAANPMSAAAAPMMGEAPSTNNSDNNQTEKNAAQAPVAAQTNSPQPVDQPKPADQSNPVNTTEKAVQQQAAEDQKTIAPDQNEILEQLKMIDSEDSKTHYLFNMAAMDQLFNNFVYFKDFIVKNFAKDKMMRLAIEFINQIYPKEHAAVLTMTSTQPNAEIKHDAVAPVEQVNHVENSNEAMPTEDEYVIPSGNDTEQQADDNYADNYYEDASAPTDDSSHLQNDNLTDINPEEQQYSQEPQYSEEDMSMAEPSEQSSNDNQVEN